MMKPLLVIAAVLGAGLVGVVPSDAASSCTQDLATANAALDELARVEASSDWSSQPSRRRTLVDDLQAMHAEVLEVCADSTTSTTAPSSTAPTTAAPVTTAPPTAPPTTTAPPAAPATPSPSLLLANVPGSPHEGILHGVPTNYDWATRATFGSLTGPSWDSNYVNLWGQIYHDSTNAHPANTRVDVADCEVWRLPATGTTWVRMQGDAALEGGSWSEDFRSTGGTFDIRSEPDFTQSMVPQFGYNAHFWTRAPLGVSQPKDRAFVTACSARLILDNPWGADDRGSAHYLVGVGADWRKFDYSCPVVGGVTTCNAIGTGRHIRVTNDWRRVVFSTMSASEVASYPALPTEVLTNPDGTSR